MQDIYVEHMVRKKRTPATMALCVLIALAAAFFAVGVFLFVGYYSYLLALVLTVGAVCGAYALICAMNIEYEYLITNGEMDVDKIVSRRRRYRLVTIPCREVEAFGPFRAGEHAGQEYRKKIFACAGADDPDLWYAVVHLAKSGRTLVVFNADERMLDAIKPFLPREVLREAFSADGAE